MIDDPFGKATVDIEKVIDGNSTKILNLKADIFYLDDERGLQRVISFRNTAIKLWRSATVPVTSLKIGRSETIPVKNDSGKVIGAASIEIQDKIVVRADIFLDYFTPERLTIETEGQKLWPHLVGWYTTVPFESREVAVAFHVSSIDLLPHPTNDDRIPCLKI